MMLNKRRYLFLGAVLVAAIAVTAGTLVDKADPVTLPAGTAIHVQLDQSLASDQNRSGDKFDATVAQPIISDGKTVIPKGAEVTGRVVDAKKSGHLMGVARLRLDLASVEVNGKTYEIETSSAHRAGGNHRKHNLMLIGGGGAGGALIGAIAAGGKGALIGGPVGAGVGTAAAYFTGKKDIRLPAESHLTFELSEPVTIDLKS
jgi:hypothetical protein